MLVEVKVTARPSCDGSSRGQLVVALGTRALSAFLRLGVGLP